MKLNYVLANTFDKVELKIIKDLHFLYFQLFKLLLNTVWCLHARQLLMRSQTIWDKDKDSDILQYY